MEEKIHFLCRCCEKISDEEEKMVQEKGNWQLLLISRALTCSVCSDSENMDSSS